MKNAVPKPFRTAAEQVPKTKTKTKYLTTVPAWSSSKESGEKFSINPSPK